MESDVSKIVSWIEHLHNDDTVGVLLCSTSERCSAAQQPVYTFMFGCHSQYQVVRVRRSLRLRRSICGACSLCSECLPLIFSIFWRELRASSRISLAISVPVLLAYQRVFPISFVFSCCVPLASYWPSIDVSARVSIDDP